MAKKKIKARQSELTFEQSLEELETVVASLEGGELGLDDALKQYERGVQRLKHCHQQLEAAEQRIALLSGVDAEGNPITESLDGQGEETLDAKASSRSRRRSRNAGGAGENAGVDDSGRLF